MILSLRLLDLIMKQHGIYLQIVNLKYVHSQDLKSAMIGKVIKYEKENNNNNRFRNYSCVIVGNSKYKI